MGLKRVVIIGADQKHYVGGLDEEGEARLKEMQAIKLTDVYQLCILDQHAIDQVTGQMSGLSRSYMLMNVGSAPDALPVLNIQPVGWYDLETCGLVQNFDRLEEQVKRNNRRGEKRETGIVTAGAGALAALDGRPSLKGIIGGNNKQ